MDSDLLRILHELSEQLALNQKITSALQSQAGSLKVRSYITLRGTDREFDLVVDASR